MRVKKQGIVMVSKYEGSQISFEDNFLGVYFLSCAISVTEECYSVNIYMKFFTLY